MTNPTTAAVDFDGCNRECRKAGKHTLRWGGCEHAQKPEPTVSMSKIYTDPEDGYPSIGYDSYTVPQLGELITAGLRASDLPVNGDDLVDIGLVAARAIVHRNEPAAPAVVPSVGGAALRDRIRRAVCEAEGFAWDTDMLEPDEYGDVADAVLAVLPAPADRAAEEHRLALSMALGLGTGATWEAILDRVTELGLPPIDQDPVARRLGLVAAHRAAVLTEAADALAAEHRLHSAPDANLNRWNPLRVRGMADAEALLRRLAGEAAPACAECGHAPDVHEEGDDPVSPGLCRACPEDGEEWHDYQAGEAAPDNTEARAETVHGCPPDGSGLTPCCGRTPFELPRTDRISSEADAITCQSGEPRRG